MRHEGVPFAARIIREEFGLTTRDDDPDEVCLPPHLTKHRCYANWCYKRGWKVAKYSKAQSIYKPTPEFDPRSHLLSTGAEDPLWLEGSERMDVCSWPTFLYYWKDHYPKIKVRAKGADTCTECLMYVNSLKLLPAPVVDGITEDTLEELLETAMTEKAEKRNESKQHVLNYQMMRNYGNKLIAESRGSNEDNNTDAAVASDGIEDDNVPIRETFDCVIDISGVAVKVAIALPVAIVGIPAGQTWPKINIIALDIVVLLPSLTDGICVTVDMGQNVPLPSVEGDQFGDAYYMTPVNLYLFGVNDNSRPDGHDHMNAYIWSEADGRRGANNIVSCLFKDFKKRGFFSSPNFGPLYMLADNCGGQNKNEDVFRFLMWLVEVHVFPSVSNMFFIKGHTNNACDRMFNLLKLALHLRNIYCFEDMVHHLNENEHISVKPIGSDEFFDFHLLLNSFYRMLETGQTNRTHLFKICSALPTTLQKQDVADSVVREDNLLPTKRNRNAAHQTPEDREEKLLSMLSSLVVLERPGMREVKQVELWSKWRPLIPEEFRDRICPKPSPKVLERVRQSKIAKRNSKKPSKKASKKA